MNEIPSYGGHTHFEKLLTQTGSAYSLAEVRAAIMRDIWSIDTVQPTETLEEILGGKPADVFVDAVFAKEFMFQFLALWSQMILHLEDATPFQLLPLEGTTPEAIRIRHKIRVAEIKVLMGLFNFDKTRHFELARAVEAAQTILEQVRATLDVEVPESETATETEAANFADALTSIETAVETLMNQVGKRIVMDRQGRIDQREQHRQFLDQHKHVGRNDPCPCGSGQKFKKCCLGGPFLSLLEEP